MILLCTIGGTGELPIRQGSNATAAAMGHGATKFAGDTNFIEFDEKEITREQLGRAAWTIMHTIAAYFPIEPTSE